MITQAEKDEVLKKHLVKLNLSLNISILPQQLRLVAAEEIECKTEEYTGFLKGEVSMSTLIRYKEPGTFSGDVGDLLIKALANALSMAMFIVTSLPSMT